MKITYDSRYNVAYIYFREAIEPVKTIEVSSEMNVDLAPDGTIYGIELLNANEQLGADQNASLTVVNEALGEASEIKLMLR
jgi:uncharacterized protein YuzE